VAGGWVIAVLVAEDGGAPERRYYAVAREDQARAEWAASDAAGRDGTVAVSPRGGQEPIEAVGRLSPDALKSAGVPAGGVKPLGLRWPRRLLGSPKVRESE
jgi:hypothetical protein